MVGPGIILMKMLHCNRMARKRSAPRPKEYGPSEGPSNRPPQNLGLKTERREYEYEQICRVCLKEGNIPIFGPVDLSIDLKSIACVEITFEDAYPKYLCHSCNSLLQAAILFRKTAQESQQILKQPGYNDMSLIDCQGEDWSDKDMQGKAEETDALNSVKIEIEIERDESEDNKQKTPFYYEKCESEGEPSGDQNFDSVKQFGQHSLPSKHDTLRNAYTEDGVNYTFNVNKEKVKSEDNRQKTYRCRKCDLTFNSLEEYDEHTLSEEHENYDTKKTCTICNKTYSSYYIKKHMLIHSDRSDDTNNLKSSMVAPAPYICDICGKKFTGTGHFKNHRATHFLELPFKCHLCPYRGRFRSTLKNHLRTHTGEKPHQCPQCPSRFFTDTSNLRKHMLTHKVDYDFKCDQCQRGFHRECYLEAHVKVDHYGIKDHICNACGKAFGYRKQMMKHQLKVHKREKGRRGITPLYLIAESKKQLETLQD